MNYSYALELLTIEIVKLTNRQEKIEELVMYSPAIDLLELRQEFSVKLKSEVDRFSPEFTKWVEVSAKKEKSLIRKMKTFPKDSQKLWDEKGENFSKLNDLSNAHSILSIRKAA